MPKLLWSILVVIFLFSRNVVGQPSMAGRFFKLSLPEIWWVAGHPFSAPDAFFAAQEARQWTDSLRKNNSLDGDEKGGKLDAFKHTYWMARMGQKMKLKWACKLGVAHEQGNKIRFFRNPGAYYEANDSVSSAMDLWNNRQGLKLAQKHPALKPKQLREKVMALIKHGKARIVKRDSKGRFLKPNGGAIPKDSLIGRWNNSKTLVPSDYEYP